MEKIKTLFISDIHLGTNMCNANKLLDVFKKYDFEKLVINGDLIDMTSMKKRIKWTPEHTKIIQKILKYSKKIEVIYIVGNHDYYIRDFIEDEMFNIGNNKI